MFKYDKIELLRKKMLNRAYVMQKEKALLGHKPMKDRLILLQMQVLT